VLCHAGRGFRHPRVRRFVGLCACASAFAKGGPPPSWSPAALQGLVAISGLAYLALALRGPPRGLDQGTASFGLIAIALIALAALVGVGPLAARVFKRRIAGIMIGVHATLAVSGFVVLAAYIFAG